ncbi:carbamoyl phosphate synthase large subunit [Arcobacter cryaerophilus gv. occultus]|uniref:ATP-grasp domain-containing protein n=1 Tax=Aliarcobacter cryaerophilus TaxID=28198 RepID=UPI000D015944|nr:ATP-grasp domain-containing protein [Aliarcobacter cryaerophilus]PRM91997.1 carbamoyl phosphate synthase large subunit [Arcobacter cryaerophilus gv. occultus]
MRNVLIAGIGGASLGTEIQKSLLLCSSKYNIYGTDISEHAYGHFSSGFEKTFKISKDRYIEDTLDICKKYNIECIIPGGEEPLKLISQNLSIFATNKIKLAINNQKVIDICSDKAKTFEVLSELGVDIPKTHTYKENLDFNTLDYPCIVKPATGSGGSNFVFFAGDKNEAILYCQYLKNNQKSPIIQEYISEDEGEYTIGVLYLPNKTMIGSIVLRRVFDSKLSVLIKGDFGLISSGYSQGLIEDFPEIRKTAEKIAEKIGSTGPLNIQARVKNGQLIPFEINPRFSASTYLRSLAGFNEIDIFLDFLFDEKISKPTTIKFGRYLRSLSETFVPSKSTK